MNGLLHIGLCVLVARASSAPNFPPKVPLTIEQFLQQRWQIETRPSTTYQNARVVYLRCNTSMSNPAVGLRWTVARVTGNPAVPKANVTAFSRMVTANCLLLTVSYKEKEFVQRINATCQAFNTTTKVLLNSTALQIEQIYPTANVIIDGPKKVKVRPGQSAKLVCKADGNPPPTYSWFNKTNDRVVQLQEKSNTLVVRSVAKRSKSKYRCQSGNTKLLNSSWVEVNGGTALHPAPHFFVMAVTSLVWKFYH